MNMETGDSQHQTYHASFQTRQNPQRHRYILRAFNFATRPSLLTAPQPDSPSFCQQLWPRNPSTSKARPAFSACWRFIRLEAGCEEGYFAARPTYRVPYHEVEQRMGTHLDYQYLLLCAQVPRLPETAMFPASADHSFSTVHPISRLFLILNSLEVWVSTFSGVASTS